MFEIDYFWNESSAIFKACIAPANDSQEADSLHEAVKKSKFYKAPQGKKWLVFHSQKFPFIASEIINEDDEEIKKRVGEIISKIKPVADDISTWIEAYVDSRVQEQSIASSVAL